MTDGPRSLLSQYHDNKGVVEWASEEDQLEAKRENSRSIASFPSPQELTELAKQRAREDSLHPRQVTLPLSPPKTEIDRTREDDREPSSCTKRVRFDSHSDK